MGASRSEVNLLNNNPLFRLTNTKSNQSIHNINFIDLLKNNLNDWRTSEVNNEWYLSNFIDQHIEPMSNIEAFEQINNALVQFFNDINFEVRYEIIIITIALARKSNTTEPPSLSQLHLEKLSTMTEGLNDEIITHVNELLAFYRIQKTPNKLLHPTP